MMMGNWEKQLAEKKEIKEKDKIRREKLSIMLLVGCVLAYALAKIGNYGEIFERNFGQYSTLQINREENDYLKNGGLLNPLPFLQFQK